MSNNGIFQELKFWETMKDQTANLHIIVMAYRFFKILIKKFPTLLALGTVWHGPCEPTFPKLQSFPY